MKKLSMESTRLILIVALICITISIVVFTIHPLGLRITIQFFESIMISLFLFQGIITYGKSHKEINKEQVDEKHLLRNITIMSFVYPAIAFILIFKLMLMFWNNAISAVIITSLALMALVAPPVLLNQYKKSYKESGSKIRMQIVNKTLTIYFVIMALSFLYELYRKIPKNN